MLKRNSIIVVCLLALALFWYYFSLPIVESTIPKRSSITQAVYAPGNVETVVMLPISPKVSGRVTKINVDEGDVVAKGQVLAEIDVDQMKSELASQNAKLDYYQKEFKRKQYLFANKVIGKDMLDASERDYTSAKYDFDAIRNNIIDAQIIAQENGRIIKKDIDIGQLIDPSQQVFWYATNQELRVTAFVDEEEINEISPGQKVFMKADAVRDKVFTGIVNSITPKGDPVARNFRVRISLDSQEALKIGMSVECNIVIKEKENAIYIPKTAIKDGKVMLINGGVLKEQEITTGIDDPQNVEVTNGLSEEDTIATTYPKLKPGTRVRAT